MYKSYSFFYVSYVPSIQPMLRWGMMSIKPLMDKYDRLYKKPYSYYILRFQRATYLQQIHLQQTFA